MLVRQGYDDKLARFAYPAGCPATGEAAVIDPERGAWAFASDEGGAAPRRDPRLIGRRSPSRATLA